MPASVHQLCDAFKKVPGNSKIYLEFKDMAGDLQNFVFYEVEVRQRIIHGIGDPVETSELIIRGRANPNA